MLCQSVSMKGFEALLTKVSPEITICVRGRHAVGKSEGVYQAAAGLRSDLYKDTKFCERMVSALGGEVRVAIGGVTEHVTEWNYDLGLPVIERRLSQMTEGDIIGLPEMHDISDGVKSWRSTAFRPCDWLIQACQFPAMLFLDERNRALPGVKQAVFQLADSKAFYGHTMHTDTRICVAENVGMNYQVEQSDPAEVSRWVTIELEPSIEEWFEWADGKVHLATIEFLRANPKLLEHTGTFEAEKKYPDRRSWYKLDQELQRLGIFDSDSPGEGNILYWMSGAFLGPETGQKFTTFVKDRDREIKATDVLTSWSKAKRRLSKGQKEGVVNSQLVEVMGKLGDWFKDEENLLTEDQARQFAAFMHDCPGELVLSVYALAAESSPNLFMVVPYIQQLVIDMIAGKDTKNLRVPTKAQIKKQRQNDADARESVAALGRGKKKKAVKK